MDTIVVAIDFTERSQRAVDLAVRIASGVGAAVHLLHVVEPIDDPAEADEETRDFHRELEEKARGRLAEVLRGIEDVDADCSVVLGHRPPAILHAAEERGALLIVMGTSPLEPGRPTVSHLVAARADRPVLLVP